MKKERPPKSPKTGVGFCSKVDAIGNRPSAEKLSAKLGFNPKAPNRRPMCDVWAAPQEQGDRT